jgi:hypothetical protein
MWKRNSLSSIVSEIEPNDTGWLRMEDIPEGGE